MYTEWILESVPVDMWIDYQLYELDIEFKSECGYGDVIAAVTAREGSAEGVVIEEDNARVLHQLVKLGDDGKETEVIRAEDPRGAKREADRRGEGDGGGDRGGVGPNKRAPAVRLREGSVASVRGSVDAALLRGEAFAVLKRAV